MSHEHIAGKWVLVESHMMKCGCSRVPHFVESVSKSRAYMYAARKEWDKETQSFRFIEEQDMSDTGYKNVKSIKFVFDNFEDAVKAGQAIYDQWQKWWDEGAALSKWNIETAKSLGGSVNV